MRIIGLQKSVGTSSIFDLNSSAFCRLGNMVEATEFPNN